MKKIFDFNNEIGQKIIKFFYKPIFILKYRPKVIGKENIPKKGPIIFCGNHIHTHDQFNVMLVSKRTIHYLAKEEYFKSKNSWIFTFGGCIPVNREIHDENAKSKAMQILKEGKALGIFPEGTRNKTLGTKDETKLLPFKYGAVSLAKKTNAQIIPFGIQGKYTGKKGHLKTIIGKPFTVENMTLEEANEHLKEEILKLIEK